MLSDGLVSSPLRFLNGCVILPLINLAGRQGLLSIDLVATSGCVYGGAGGAERPKGLIAICISNRSNRTLSDGRNDVLEHGISSAASCILVFDARRHEAGDYGGAMETATWDQESYSLSKAFLHAFCSSGRVMEGLGALNMGSFVVSSLRFVTDPISDVHHLIAASSQGSVFVYKPSLISSQHGRGITRYSLCNSFELRSGAPRNTASGNLGCSLDGSALSIVWEQFDGASAESSDSLSSIYACVVDISLSSPSYLARPGVLVRSPGPARILCGMSGNVWIYSPLHRDVYFYDKRTKRVLKSHLDDQVIACALDPFGGHECLLVVCKDGALSRVSFKSHPLGLVTSRITCLLPPGHVCQEGIDIFAYILEDILVVSRGCLTASLPMHILRDTAPTLALRMPSNTNSCTFFDFSPVLCRNISQFPVDGVQLNIFYSLSRHYGTRLIVSSSRHIADAGPVFDGLRTDDESQRPFIRSFDPSQLYIAPSKLIRDLSWSRSFAESYFLDDSSEASTASLNCYKENSVLTDRKPKIGDLSHLNIEETSCMDWLHSSDALILPPLQSPASRIEDFLFLEDLIKIATEDAFAYRKLKDAVDENNTWKTAYDEGTVNKEDIVDITIEDHFTNLCKFYWIEYPAYFYDLIRHLETFRGGWRGDSARALINYKAHLYSYFGEPIDDADGSDEESESGGELSEEGRPSEDEEEVPTSRDLIKMKAHYVDRIVKIFHLADDSAPDFSSFSPPQIKSLVKLLVWGGRFELAFDLLIRTEMHDDLVLLLEKMHSFVQSSLDGSDLQEPVRAGLERCTPRALAALSGASREQVLRLAPLCDVVKTESMML